MVSYNRPMEERTTVDLGAEERQLMAEVLESAYRHLKQEIGRTEGYEFKQQLQARRDMLHGLIEKVTGESLAD